jgi:hypothetical protein
MDEIELWNAGYNATSMCSCTAIEIRKVLIMPFSFVHTNNGMYASALTLINYIHSDVLAGFSVRYETKEIITNRKYRNVITL